MGVLEGFRKGVGLGALVLALASPSYAAGPAKKNVPAKPKTQATPLPYPTPTAVSRQDPSTFTSLIGQYGQLKNTSYINIHFPENNDINKNWLVFMDKNDKVLGVYDNATSEFMKDKQITPLPKKIPTAVPTSTPITIYEPLSLMPPTLAAAHLPTPVPAVTKIPTGSLKIPDATPTPKSAPKIRVPLIVGGNASVGYSTEKITGTIFDGTRWQENHSGLAARIKDATVRTSENYGKALFHGGLLVDASYLSGSIAGLESGKFKDIEAFARLFAGAGRKFSDSLTLLGQLGAGYAIKSDKFQYAGGTFSKSSNTSLRPPGLEFRLLALTPSVNLGLRGKHLVYSAAQNGYSSRDTEDQFAIVAEIPKIETSKGPLRANIEAGLRPTNSRGLSGQGDWKQSIVYALLEVGKDVNGLPVFGYFGLDTLARQPDVGFSLGSTRYLAGLGIKPFYKLGGDKK